MKIETDDLAHYIYSLNQLESERRLQLKYELLCKIMEGEGGNDSANIWVTMMADFAIALMNHGHEPRHVLLNIGRDARKLVDQKLKEQRIVLDAPKGTTPN